MDAREGQDFVQHHERVSTGVEGLDALMLGGLLGGRVYLVEGDPGAGKTTLALQFLLDGMARGERVLLASLAETASELRDVASSHGWDLSALEVLELAPSDLGLDEQYSILPPSEVELGTTLSKLQTELERRKPRRVVLDSLSELRLLAQSTLRYRRQILAVKQMLTHHDCTALLLDDRSTNDKDLTVQSLMHGVVELQKHSPVYGKGKRRLQIMKLRGTHFQTGFHDFEIVRGGLEVYPRLIAADHHETFLAERIASGSTELDEMLGGGLDRGTTTLVLGPAGSGKSSFCLHYTVQAVERGEKAVVFTFDEGLATFKERSRALGMDLQPLLDADLLRLRQIDPAEMSPGEFLWRVKEAVGTWGARTVVVDSLTGYLDSMPESQFLTIQMHQMLTYLRQVGVMTMLTMAQHGYMGTNMKNPADVSYLADTVVLLRYFEHNGGVRKAISVVKKRSGMHQNSIREFDLSPGRLVVGEELRAFQGVLTGVPTFLGLNDSMMNSSHVEDRR